MRSRFEIERGIDHSWVTLNGQSVEFFHPHSSLLDRGFDQKQFVKEANQLLDKYEKKYRIRVPTDFPKPIIAELALFGKEAKNYNAWIGYCFCNIIILERDYGVDALPLLYELMRRGDLLHSTSVSVVAVDYLEKRHEVKLFPKTGIGRNPDLLIDDVTCDVKARREADWTQEIKESERKKEFVATGKGPCHEIRDDICYDIGMAIGNRGSKGIQQAEMLLVDLSLKSLPWLHRMGGVRKQKLPCPKKHRIVFFTWEYGGDMPACSGYYLDLEPSLWKAIRSCNKTMRIVKSSAALLSREQ
jgi:hypothetical protein